MFSYSYKMDRIELVPPGRGEVAGKIKAIVEVSPVGYRQPPFLSESGYLPPKVLGSMVMRRLSLWGRYE